MTKKTKRKLQYLFNNLEDDIARRLRSNLKSSFLTKQESIDKAKSIMYLLSPYGKDLRHYRFKKWRK